MNVGSGTGGDKRRSLKRWGPPKAVTATHAERFNKYFSFLFLEELAVKDSIVLLGQYSPCISSIPRRWV